MSQSSFSTSGLRRRNSKTLSSARILSTTDTMNSERGTEVRQNVSDWASQDKSKKTLSRLVVENFLLKFKWYNPHRDRNDTPNLKEGWAFYEHVTLGRRKTGSKDNKAGLQRALPGETGETELYNYFTTPESSFKDWGVGIALYFSTVGKFALFLFVAGILSLRNILYFNSDDYDGAVDPSRRVNSWLLRGSAICNSTLWVECEKGYCDLDQMRDYDVTYAEGGEKIFVERSACPVSDSNDNDILKAGFWNMSIQIMLILMTYLFSLFQSRQQTIIDEDVITASDYAIQVVNPPEDAYDPDEWRDFFSTYDNDKGVTLVTIILNNAPLLRALRARRYFRKELMRRLPDVDIDSPNLRTSVVEKAISSQAKSRSIPKLLFNITLRPILRIFNMYLDPEVLYKKINEKTEEVKELQKNDYGVSSVIVTFESESGKRTALEALSASKIAVRAQKTEGRNDLFRDRILEVIEPSEPSAIRYLNLDAGLMKRAIQFAITLAITLGLVVVCFFAVRKTRADINSFWAGILTTSFNIVIPFIVRLLCLIETHAREDDLQRSLYIKVTIFRWVNTAIATKFAVPFTSTLGNQKEDLLVGISGILLAEIWIAPLLAVLDIVGNLNKHYFAPRSKVKEQMFLCFKGTYYNLADKYTDITKIIFVCYYYSALNPSLFFMGAVVLTVRYLSDKFCLLRLWGTVPNVGTQVAEFSRKYFISLAVVFGTIVSAYDWALFNFDRVCDGQTSFDEGTYNVNITNKFGETFVGEITTNATVFVEGKTIDIPTARVCDGEKCCQNVGFNWPPIPSQFETDNFKWMTEGQREVTTVYGWFSVVILFAWLIMTFGRTVISLIKSTFVGGVNRESLGKNQDVDFSNLEIDGYIPQIHDPGLTYPLISCRVPDIPDSLLGFLVSEGDCIDNYNLTLDVPFEDIPDDGKKGERHVFDIVKYWPYGEDE